MAAIVADYEAGLASTDLMVKYNLSKCAVLRLLNKAGVKLRRQGLSTEQIGEAIELYRAGLHWLRSVSKLVSRRPASFTR